MRAWWMLWCCLGLVLLSSCTRSVVDPPDLGQIYNRSAQYHGVERNPVIVIPGILGSKLVEEGTQKVIWGAFSGDYADPANPEDARLIALPLDMAMEVGIEKPKEALDRLRVGIFGLPLELRAYAQILGALGVGGYRDEQLGEAGVVDYGEDHYTCFQFAYDWRDDNARNARKLHEFILEKREYVRQKRLELEGIDQPDVKFDIIAHSMGGLITRYYLRYGAAPLVDDNGAPPELTWAGAEHVDTAILVATPSGGSPFAIKQLVDGIYFSFLLPRYSPTILGTMLSIYQLLPRGRSGALIEDGKTRVEDLYDPEVWRKYGWGLAAEDQDDELQKLLPEVETAEERRAIALAYQEAALDRARRFAAALDAPAKRPEELDLFLVAGDSVPTPTVLSVDSESGAVSVVETGPGDGTVPRYSTVWDRRVGGEWQPHLDSPIDWSHVTFLFNDHLGLTMSPEFIDNVLYLLLERPR